MSENIDLSHQYEVTWGGTAVVMDMGIELDVLESILRENRRLFSI
jgi:hypothetical protein